MQRHLVHLDTLAFKQHIFCFILVKNILRDILKSFLGVKRLTESIFLSINVWPLEIWNMCDLLLEKGQFNFAFSNMFRYSKLNLTAFRTF